MWMSYIVLCVIMQLHKCIAIPLWNKYQNYSDLHSVKIFQEYLRIDTSYEANIEHAIDFWSRQMSDLGIPFSIYRPAGKPIFVATLTGSDACLPSIMLNSHMDVVKADKSEWKYPPFDAYMEENGDIYARGAQDTKDVAIQYLEAIRQFKQDKATLLRTLHITLMPDEETSGENGMGSFVKTQEFKSLNIGFALDEGLTNVGDYLTATYGERRAWQMQFIIHGDGGHSYKMLNTSAMVKAQKFINAVMTYRDSQIRLINMNSSNGSTEFTSVNINLINTGTAVNVIPSKVFITVDMRLAIDADVATMDNIVNSWMIAAGNTTELKYYRKLLESAKTAVDDSNPYWVTMRNTLNEMSIEVKPVVSPAVSDSIYLRNLGIPVIGFSTKRRTIPRLHDKDEYQNVEIFLKGIEIYTKLIKSLANLPK